MPKPFHSPAVTVNAKTVRAFRGALVRWFRRHHRDLPWRRTRDPYAIWVSEIMLQQTRVETVIPYYQRWLKAFPTVSHLARANPERVLRLWEGLGYYRRARNLHRAARLLVSQCGHDQERSSLLMSKWEDLPGIGPYTAGAIASLAFDRRVALVDGNVARVFARVFGLRANVKLPRTQKQLWALAETLLPSRGCGEFNESLMELGALVCVPATPACGACPLARVCMARLTGQQESLPNRGKPAKMRAVIQDVAWVQRDGHLLLRQRPLTGLLAGMWELPRAKANGEPLLQTKHTIMNQRITLRVFPASKDTGGTGQWIPCHRLKRLPMPAAHRRAVDRLLV